MDNQERLLYQIALTKVKGVGTAWAKQLMEVVGDEKEIFNEKKSHLLQIPRMPAKIIHELRSPQTLREAEEELNFALKNKIRVLFYKDQEFPERLHHCVDSPILLYAKGEANFNPPKVLSIVGTRNASRYGKEFCEKLVADIAAEHPDTLIVSGLAYGIDICAHRAALQNNLSTVAVLAHGLDRIYPAVHRRTAIDMLEEGALLTEFPTQTEPERFNFVERNRIVAGMSDVVVVVESAGKGGSLITADIANSYFREVFAVPGRLTDTYSAGTNKLIAQNKAILLQDAEGLIKHMGWDMLSSEPVAVQQELFLDLTEEERVIYDALSLTEPKQVNILAVELNIPVSELFFILLELEMKNIVKALPGGMYKLAL